MTLTQQQVLDSLSRWPRRWRDLDQCQLLSAIRSPTARFLPSTCDAAEARAWKSVARTAEAAACDFRWKR